jgi:hypothetical protein
LDSNQDLNVQSVACYHYTTPQFGFWSLFNIAETTAFYKYFCLSPGYFVGNVVFTIIKGKIILGSNMASSEKFPADDRQEREKQKERFEIPIPGKEKGSVVLAGLITGVPTALVRGEKGDIVVKTEYGETYAEDDSPAAIEAAIARMREIVAGNR